MFAENIKNTTQKMQKTKHLVFGEVFPCIRSNKSKSSTALSNGRTLSWINRPAAFLAELIASFIQSGNVDSTTGFEKYANPSS